MTLYEFGLVVRCMFAAGMFAILVVVAACVLSSMISKSEGE